MRGCLLACPGGLVAEVGNVSASCPQIVSDVFGAFNGKDEDSGDMDDAIGVIGLGARSRGAIDSIRFGTGRTRAWVVRACGGKKIYTRLPIFPNSY